TRPPTASPSFPTRRSSDLAQVLQGKQLSYNNILDCDAALNLCLELDGPSAVVVKHTNPCGAASHPDGVATAYRLARETDPVSALDRKSTRLNSSHVKISYA